MFGDLPTYGSYSRPAGLWLPRPPAHWPLFAGGAVLPEVKEKNRGLAESTVLSLSFGRVIVKPQEKLRGLVPESFEDYQILQPGDVVIRPTDLQNDQSSLRVGQAKDRGIITSAYIGLRPTGIDPAFAFSYLAALDHLKVFYGMGSGLRQTLDYRDFKRLPVPVPPAEEQAAIVKYLGHAQARIDRAIAAKRKLIDLLEEQDTAVAAALLTGILSVQGEDRSGVWDWVPAGRLCTIVTGVENSGNAQPDGPYPFFVRGREVLRSNTYMFDTEAVMTPGDGQGGVGKVFHYYSGKFQAHQRVYVFKDFRGVLPKYFYWHLKTFFHRFALSRSNTVTMESLRRPMLRSFSVPVPPLVEQAAIVQRVEAELARSGKTIDAARREIDLLREFRTRLTVDVVTGQSDVRAIVATLPELPAEQVLDVGGDEEDGSHDEEQFDAVDRDS